MFGIVLPVILSESQLGQFVWAFVVSFGVILPLSLPRYLTSTKYNNLMCFIFMVYFIVTIASVCLFDRKIVPNLANSMQDAAFNHSKTFLPGLITSMPTLIFLLMY